MNNTFLSHIDPHLYAQMHLIQNGSNDTRPSPEIPFQRGPPQSSPEIQQSSWNGFSSLITPTTSTTGVTQGIPSLGTWSQSQGNSQTTTQLAIERLSAQELNSNTIFRENWEARIRLEAENTALKYIWCFWMRDLLICTTDKQSR